MNRSRNIFGDITIVLLALAIGAIYGVVGKHCPPVVPTPVPVTLSGELVGPVGDCTNFVQVRLCDGSLTFPSLDTPLTIKPCPVPKEASKEAIPDWVTTAIQKGSLDVAIPDKCPCDATIGTSSSCFEANKEACSDSPDMKYVELLKKARKEVQQEEAIKCPGGCDSGLEGR